MSQTTTVKIYGKGSNLSLCHHFRTTMGPTQTPIQWVPGALSVEDKVAKA